MNISFASHLPSHKTPIIHEYLFNGHSIPGHAPRSKSISIARKLLDKLLSIPLDTATCEEAYEVCLQLSKYEKFQMIRLAWSLNPDESEIFRGACAAKRLGSIPLDEAHNTKGIIALRTPRVVKVRSKLRWSLTCSGCCLCSKTV